MATGKNVLGMYEAMFKLKALKEPVKVSALIPCKLAIVLAMSVEYGLSSVDQNNLIPKIITEEEQGKLLDFVLNVLRKGEVEDCFATLKEFSKSSV